MNIAFWGLIVAFIVFAVFEKPLVLWWLETNAEKHFSTLTMRQRILFCFLSFLGLALFGFPCTILSDLQQLTLTFWTDTSKPPPEAGYVFDIAVAFALYLLVFARASYFAGYRRCQRDELTEKALYQRARWRAIEERLTDLGIDPEEDILTEQAVSRLYLIHPDRDRLQVGEDR